MQNKLIWLALILVVIIVIAGVDTKKGELKGCTKSDNQDIWTKGICYDGNIYYDTCRINNQPALIEISCSNQGLCKSEMIDCGKYGGYCYNGKCVT